MLEMLVLVIALFVEPSMCQIRPRECQPHNEGETQRGKWSARLGHGFKYSRSPGLVAP